jgi:hypothetical protein
MDLARKDCFGTARDTYREVFARDSYETFTGLLADGDRASAWAQAQYLRVVRDLQTGAVLDQPGITRGRYVKIGPPAVVPLTISSPAPGAITPTATTMVSGPGANVDIAAGQPGSATNTTSVVATVADAQGAFQGAIPTPPGSTLITVTAPVGRRATCSRPDPRSPSTAGCGTS